LCSQTPLFARFSSDCENARVSEIHRDDRKRVREKNETKIAWNGLRVTIVQVYLFVRVFFLTHSLTMENVVVWRGGNSRDFPCSFPSRGFSLFFIF
jgi:hypothetical protein